MYEQRELSVWLSTFKKVDKHTRWNDCKKLLQYSNTYYIYWITLLFQGYSAFSTILERVTSMSSECGSRWEPLLIEINKISEHQNAQRALFREKIESIQVRDIWFWILIWCCCRSSYKDVVYYYKVWFVKIGKNFLNFQLQLTSPTLEARRLHPPTPNTTQEVTATMLAITDQVVLIKKLVAQVVSDWNAKVENLHKYLLKKMFWQCIVFCL